MAKRAAHAAEAPDAEGSRPGFHIIGSAGAIADTFAALLDTYPTGSRVEKTDGLWHFYRGAGNTSHGCGKTLSRAIASANSTRVPNRDTGRIEEIAEDGTVLPPE